MTLNTYLTFESNCRDAFEFYREAFGGEFLVMKTFAAGPDMGVPAAEMDRIMHVSLPIGESVLMGSDSCAVFGPPPVAGNNFSISIQGQSKEHCDELFARLSQGGTVKMPLQETFWSAYFGQWTDRFGINWMIDFDISATQPD